MPKDFWGLATNNNNINILNRTLDLAKNHKKFRYFVDSVKIEPNKNTSETIPRGFWLQVRLHLTPVMQSFSFNL